MSMQDLYVLYYNSVRMNDINTVVYVLTVNVWL